MVPGRCSGASLRVLVVDTQGKTRRYPKVSSLIFKILAYYIKCIILLGFEDFGYFGLRFTKVEFKNAKCIFVLVLHFSVRIISTV